MTSDWPLIDCAHPPSTKSSAYVVSPTDDNPPFFPTPTSTPSRPPSLFMTETWIDRNPVHQGKLILRNIEKHEALTNQPVSFYEAAASAAVQAAFRLKAKVIIVHTKDGSLAKTVAKCT